MIAAGIGVGINAKIKMKLADGFNRADSTTSLGIAPTGQSWTANIGTWGISGGRAYSVSNTAGDLASIDTGKADGEFACVMKGAITDGSNNSVPILVFRMNDNTNFLMARISVNQLALIKDDAGSFITLATVAQTMASDTDYTILVQAQGNRVVVFINGVSKIDYTLTGGDTKYAAYTKMGMRLSKAGAPASNASWDLVFMDVS